MQPTAQISWLDALALTLSQPAGASLYLGLVSCLLLALVAGMLLLLGRNLRVIKTELKRAPLLADELAGQLRHAREAMGKLQQAALEAGPELEKHVAAAAKARQELQYLSARAEQLLQKMEAGTAAASKTLVTLEGTKMPILPREDKVLPARPAGPLAAYGQITAAAEQPLSRVEEIAPVVVAKPVRTGGRRVTADPLDELLAGLNDTPSQVQTTQVLADAAAPRVTRRAKNGAATTAATPSKERRAVSQAELELRASLGGGRHES